MDGSSVWLSKALLALPTTKLRVLLGIVLNVWTAYHVLEQGPNVSTEWLVYLAASNGIDISQYAINKQMKRSTETTNDT